MKNKKELIVTALIFLVGTALLAFRISKESFWADEAFTGVLIRHSFSDIYELCKVEMHSAFYYWGVRLFSLIFGSGEISLRVFSLLGTVSLAALGPTAVKRLFSRDAGLVFAVSVFLAPGLLAYSQEARMYTWAAFFTAAMALYAYLSLREKKKKDLILFSIFLISAMYTHILGMVASFFFNIIFIGVIFAKKDFSFFKKYSIAAGIAALLFIPRLYYIVEQASRVNDNFWIGPYSTEKLINSIQFLFGLKFWGSPLSLILTAFVLTISISSLVYLIIKRDKNLALLLSLAGGYSATIMFLIAYSILLKPILEPRYTLVIGGWMLLFFACSMYRCHRAVIIIVMLIYCGLAFSINRETYNHRYNGPMREVIEDLEPRIENDHVFVHTDEHTLGTFTYYFPNHKHYFLVNEKSTVFWYLEIFKPYGDYGPNLEELIGNAESIWFVDRIYGFNNNLFDAQFQDFGSVEYSNTYMVGRSWYKPFVKLYKKE
jgi:hypothetical protein